MHISAPSSSSSSPLPPHVSALLISLQISLSNAAQSWGKDSIRYAEIAATLREEARRDYQEALSSGIGMEQDKNTSRGQEAEDDKIRQMREFEEAMEMLTI